MALLPIHKYFGYNGKIKPVKEFVASENEGGIYEVLRVVNGVPLFVEEHLERFKKSAQIAGKNIRFSCSEIRDHLQGIINENEVYEGNILVSCKSNLKVFFIPHKYPVAEQYKNGVNCGVLHAERNNPNAKVFQTEVRLQANRLIAENNFYEVFLVDKNEKVTEGSRSNVFFIKEDKIFTPVAEQVLLGITRQNTMKCAAELGIPVEEIVVDWKELETFDAVFITGTSPKILPVKQIDNNVFCVENKILRQLMDAFEKNIENYISDKKNLLKK